ncbi:hypothetical protein [Frankia sp. AgB32]|uniref:hypothetical protein n=1 Tax=Frankia sp. AgB32 TaxID=631119 RepID=UPI00201006DF|nr:hypothetical protein [Frankia sp. AgB32]MCK9895207.1 hypothetical protein [Frankia sp. AgB32]
MSWAEERREDRASQLRIQAEVRERALRLQADLTDAREARRENLRKERKQERDDARGEAREKREAWRAEHSVDLMVYPMAVVCGVISIPAMAHYGKQIYGNATGYGLPVISELGMWAFAAAVAHTEKHYPDRPTSRYTMGIFVFASVGAVMNYLHGSADGHGATRGIMMAIVSVAGVIAHQIAIAKPRVSRAERAQRRLDQLAHRKLVKARRVAIRRAAVDLAGDGSAELVYTPGRSGMAAPRLRALRVGLSPVPELRAWRQQVLAATDPDITRVLHTLGVPAAQTALPAAVAQPETAALPAAGRVDLALPAGTRPAVDTALPADTAVLPAAVSGETFEAPDLAPVAADETAAVSRQSSRPAVPAGSETSRSAVSRTALGETSGQSETSRSVSRTAVSRTAVSRTGRDETVPARDETSPVVSRSAGTSRGTSSRRAEMTAWVLEQRAAGRTPTGADLDRKFGTRDYGRTVLRALRDSETQPAGTAREALDAARARARDAAAAQPVPDAPAVREDEVGPVGSGERDATAAVSDTAVVSVEPAVSVDGSTDLVGARS